MIRRLSFVLLALSLSGPALAADPSSVPELRAARQHLAARAAGLKPNARRSALLRERREIDRLIADLERGRSVDPSAVDDALRRADQLAP